jgi:hypothetical protein
MNAGEFERAKQPDLHGLQLQHAKKARSKAEADFATWQPAPSAARNSTGPMIPKTLQALLIFAGMVALIIAYRFLSH